jgi:hypothetical protein
LTQFDFPSSVTTIGPFAFCDCSGLVQLDVPSGVTTIWESAFHGCSALIQVEIPSSVTTIGSGAFWGCRGLTLLQIPSNVSSLGDDHVCVFGHVAKLGRLALLGSPLSEAVVAHLQGCLTPAAKVFGSASLVGQKFGRFTIAAA